MATLELPFHLLTETERLCLRLVHEGLTSKQIAEQQSMPPAAVDRILRVARAKLNGLPRHEAARRLVEHESAQGRPDQDESGAPMLAQSPRQSLGAQRLALAADPEITPTHPVESPNEGHQDPPAPGAARQLARANWSGLRSWLFGSDGSLRNDLETWSRIAAMSVIAAGAACIAGIALSLFIVLDRIATSL